MGMTWLSERSAAKLRCTAGSVRRIWSTPDYSAEALGLRVSDGALETAVSSYIGTGTEVTVVSVHDVGEPGYYERLSDMGVTLYSNGMTMLGDQIETGSGSATAGPDGVGIEALAAERRLRVAIARELGLDWTGRDLHRLKFGPRVEIIPAADVLRVVGMCEANETVARLENQLSTIRVSKEEGGDVAEQRAAFLRRERAKAHVPVVVQDEWLCRATHNGWRAGMALVRILEQAGSVAMFAASEHFSGVHDGLIRHGGYRSHTTWVPVFGAEPDERDPGGDGGTR
jgi:hypothetical protein